MKRLFLFISALCFLSSSAVFAASPGDMEILGRHIYKDKDISFYGTQSCQDCHFPKAGFADPTNLLDPDYTVVSTGADGVSKGGRNAPTSAYAGFSPVLVKKDGEWTGGMFWDGRAEGFELGDPLAEQAKGPPLNPGEMAMPDEESVINVIASSSYAKLFEKVFGPDAFADIYEAYNNFGRAIAAYERSKEVTRFSSKYDVDRKNFTPAEERGLALFIDNCASCHSMTVPSGAPAAVFTGYGYANIGTPANPLIPGDPDLGLGPVVDDPYQNGKFKIPTLRNTVFTPPYTHNGSFATLSEMVNFINDRSAYTPEVSDNLDVRVGSLGLSEAEINDIISFLYTLTDNY